MPNPSYSRHGRDSLAGIAWGTDLVYRLGVETILSPDHSEPHPPCLTIQSTRSAFQP